MTPTNLSSNCITNSCTQIQKGSLYIATALAAITVIGGILGILALNGVNIGGVNALAAEVGSTTIYAGTAIAAGATLLLICAALKMRTVNPERSAPVEQTVPLAQKSISNIDQALLDAVREASGRNPTNLHEEAAKLNTFGKAIQRACQDFLKSNPEKEQPPLQENEYVIENFLTNFSMIRRGSPDPKIAFQTKFFPNREKAELFAAEKLGDYTRK